MDYFTKLNLKMDNGWKLTDKYCSKCQVAFLINPEQSTLHCANCRAEKEINSISRSTIKNSGITAFSYFSSSPILLSYKYKYKY